jgi:hypothetical protein
MKPGHGETRGARASCVLVQVYRKACKMHENRSFETSSECGTGSSSDDDDRCASRCTVVR